MPEIVEVGADSGFTEPAELADRMPNVGHYSLFLDIETQPMPAGPCRARFDRYLAPVESSA
jgi:hypothetical protein